MGIDAVYPALQGRRPVVLGEGGDLFTQAVLPSLAGTTPAESRIGEQTGLNVVADYVDDAIAARAPDHTLLILGASEEGLLTRLTGNLGPLDVVEKVNCSVLLAETAHERSLMERLFGSRTDGFDDVIKAQGTAS